ncbi:hypothetical protein HOY80DRAFT_974201 [Tuber brumale]|nr:hypothetical protein HOY80DRAFT_974201 [Tuber brumale]
MEVGGWKKRKGDGKGDITISNHRSGNRICTKKTGCTHAPICTQIFELRVLKDLEGRPSNWQVSQSRWRHSCIVAIGGHNSLPDIPSFYRTSILFSFFTPILVSPLFILKVLPPLLTSAHPPAPSLLTKKREGVGIHTYKLALYVKSLLISS